MNPSTSKPTPMPMPIASSEPSAQQARGQDGGGKALFAGALAALLASACCLGPLVLILIGVSGAWIAHLTALEPYQPLFLGTAFIALFFAARKIWRPATTAAACEPGQVCATPVGRRAHRGLFGLVVVLLIATVGFPLIASWFY